MLLSELSHNLQNKTVLFFHQLIILVDDFEAFFFGFLFNDLISSHDTFDIFFLFLFSFQSKNQLLKIIKFPSFFSIF
jgi:hypothetical protein